MAKQTQPPTKITPQDLEDKFRALQGEIQGQVTDRKTSIASVAAGGGFLLLVIIFLLGRRSGRKRTSVVEIRRI